MNLEILKRDDMHYGGFAGLREHRLVMGRNIFGFHSEPDTWDGIGNFVYLADAKFNPHGETRMHPHHEIDVLTIMVDGTLDHEGSLENGETIETGDIQVQRAGGEGFEHNEINPANTKNRMLQFWVLPETKGEPASYKLYKHPMEKKTRIYGGLNSTDLFNSHTVIDVINLKPIEIYNVNENSLVYIFQGNGSVDNKEIEDGNLLRSKNYTIKATSDMKFFMVYEIR